MLKWFDEDGNEVTDPAILAQLNAGDAASTTQPAPRQPASPSLLQQSVETTLEPFQRLGRGLYDVLKSPFIAAGETAQAARGVARGDYEPLKQIGQEALRGTTEAVRGLPAVVGGTLGAMTPVPGGMALGAAGGEALAQLTESAFRGERPDPRELAIGGATAGLASALPAPALRGTGKTIRGVGRNLPGASAELQSEAIQQARQAVQAVPAPSAAPRYGELQAVQTLGGAETIAVPELAAQAAKVAKDLQPIITGWKMVPNARLQGAATALDSFLQAGGSELSLPQLQGILENLGPSVQRAAGPAGGAIKSLWSAAKRGLQEAADAGSQQAQMLLDAQKTHRRYEAIQAKTGSRETPSLRELVEQNIGPTESSGGRSELQAHKILERLPKTDIPQQVDAVAARLQAVLNPEEVQYLRGVFENLSKTPAFKKFGSVKERILPYAVGVSSGIAMGGIEGYLGALAGGEVLAQLASTPVGRSIVRKLSHSKLGTGGGTSALTKAAPALASYIQSQQKRK